jgi:hypothetical protein
MPQDAEAMPQSSSKLVYRRAPPVLAAAALGEGRGECDCRGDDECESRAVLRNNTRGDISREGNTSKCPTDPLDTW